MRCLDRDQAMNHVQTIQVAVLRGIAATEEDQQQLEGAAVWLPEEDAEHVRATPPKPCAGQPPSCATRKPCSATSTPRCVPARLRCADWAIRPN
jgi:hypothetical protein